MRNGALNPRPAVRLPTTGPATEPTRNALENIPATFPRALCGLIRIISPSAEMKNIVDPTPPSERNNSSCQYVCANAHAPVDTATMSRPLT